LRRCRRNGLWCGRVPAAATATGVTYPRTRRRIRLPISLDFTPRLVASDIDGTILPATGAVSRRTRDVFARSVDSGLDVVLVTGRPRSEERRVGKECRSRWGR